MKKTAGCAERSLNIIENNVLSRHEHKYLKEYIMMMMLMVVVMVMNDDDDNIILNEYGPTKNNPVNSSFWKSLRI